MKKEIQEAMKNAGLTIGDTYRSEIQTFYELALAEGRREGAQLAYIAGQELGKSHRKIYALLTLLEIATEIAASGKELPEGWESRVQKAAKFK